MANLRIDPTLLLRAHISQASAKCSRGGSRVSWPFSNKASTSSSSNAANLSWDLLNTFGVRLCPFVVTDASFTGGISEGGVGGALGPTGNGGGFPLRCLIQRSRHDCHGC